MIGSVTAKKKKLRRTFLNVRESLSEKETNQLSKRIINRLIEQSFFKKANTIHLYISIDQNREVSTRDLIRFCLDKGIKIVVPKMDAVGSLTHHHLTSVTELRPNRWGVPEPVHDKIVHLDEISLVIVPMVAADFAKNRLGYGKGYYDRFLKNLDAYRVGLCYNCTLSWCTLPTNHLDQPMNSIITESTIL